MSSLAMLFWTRLLSKYATVANAQQLPQLPWSWIGVMMLWSLQSNDGGGAAILMTMLLIPVSVFYFNPFKVAPFNPKNHYKIYFLVKLLSCQKIKWHHKHHNFIYKEEQDFLYMLSFWWYFRLDLSKIFHILSWTL